MEDEAEAFYTPQEFCLLEALELSHTGDHLIGDRRLNLTLRLRSDQARDHRRLSLVFTGVTNLEFARNQTWNKDAHIYFLKITPTERHWDWANYRVIDFEEERLSFWCEDFEMSILDPSADA